MSNSSSDFHRQLIDEEGIDRATGFSQEGQDQRFRVILNHCLRTPITWNKVLDYGCNTGGLLDYIWHGRKVPAQLDYTGVDLVTEFLVRLKEKHPKAKTLMGCITDDDVFKHLKEQGPYNYVIASGAFCYADQKLNHLLMLQRLWDLTKDTLAVNFLSDSVSHERRTSKLIHVLYPPQFGIEVANALGCKYFTVHHEYRENDFTLALHRNPR